MTGLSGGRPSSTSAITGKGSLQWSRHGSGARDYAAAKLERKRLDAIVVNDISRPGIGFDTAENEVTILSGDGRSEEVPRAGKDLVARVVLDEVERLRAAGERASGRERAGSATGA